MAFVFIQNVSAVNHEPEKDNQTLFKVEMTDSGLNIVQQEDLTVYVTSISESPVMTEDIEMGCACGFKKPDGTYCQKKVRVCGFYCAQHDPSLGNPNSPGEL